MAESLCLGTCVRAYVDWGAKGARSIGTGKKQRQDRAGELHCVQAQASIRPPPML